MSESNAAIKQPPSKRKLLKSGKVCTVDSMVLRNITWPHEFMYTVAGQPAVYKELSITVFMSGHLLVMETSKQALKPIMAKHLKEIVADAEVYG